MNLGEFHLINTTCRLVKRYEKTLPAAGLACRSSKEAIGGDSANKDVRWQVIFFFA